MTKDDEAARDDAASKQRENATEPAAEAMVPAGTNATRTAARLSEYGFFFDFDGTLAPIQQDPQSVQPAVGVLAALSALAARAAVTAVVSARPVAFLAGRLGAVPGLRLHGLYGLEYSADGGASVRTSPEAESYVPLIARVVADARAAFPGALIEDKRLSCALHFRADPDLEPRIDAWAGARAEADGLLLQHGRMVVELKPPVETDKGAVVLRAAAGLAGAWYFGDDLGDLPAFAALDRLVAERPGFHAVRVAVGVAEGRGAALGGRADLLLDAPPRVPLLLDSLLTEPHGSGAP
ncbi:trehalose-phosphatase [Actinocrinis puniceicyclus]|uniref:Trehalose 6-phosphate phosphatase n=1 Tax=Actinocrinis puniceicyclus TaxID=977794 RepID=A0A8J8BCN7_9ACTN|nr:trehalose-phosphatase [Actinocrinis puniceicyclus]MBS2963306.1 trehalose-phosphatase [Actinocrinis puniceicyclus]